MNSHLSDDGETVQVDIKTIIKAGSDRAQFEEDNLRRELRRCYSDFEELCDIHVRLTRKRLHGLSSVEVEDEVLDLAREFNRRRRARIWDKLRELFGGR